MHKKSKNGKIEIRLVQVMKVDYVEVVLQDIELKKVHQLEANCSFLVRMRKFSRINPSINNQMSA